ncbi:MAG: 1-phosphofructokinase family hexose kinase [Desulfomonilia bacterium]|jgi:6-phosphofructokinase 2|uniref:Putative ATP-dependent 6-phosphofructokinase isozyme 2 n=1 Tax=anaerobic digester metagenome TaxID=1263854 RepID=A0A485LZD4_9ZZZZ|nr:1-phosphofructokinase family hexose kinase [Pseudomonadota bacterium]HPD20590.1 1-phosphofructokinase family hexose kinase [Deltaproteobacteria bacterium]HPX17320.1 1-phosphofructokinase family hexose kinase [Deltaproteobacteria bacterium]HRS55488.1 1-phosphofructokinase family hexose kinase [Desulfomonilia bacterium]HRV35099.1 1-phosphofructokinase family hexose kinase [Desulfomonilia bacterium]
MAEVVTVTLNPSIDTSAQVSQVMADHKMRCSEPSHEPGGGGINVSRAIKKLGGESLAFFPAGQHYGKLLRGLLQNEGVEFRHVEIAGQTRENFIVREETSGRQFRFGLPGPVMGEDECGAILTLLDTLPFRPAYIVGSGSLPPGAPVDFYALLGRKASKLGARYVVDTSGEALCRIVESPVYLIKPNRRELSLLAGEEVLEEDDLADAARGLISKGISEIVVVSLGAGGAMLVTREGCRRIHAPSVRAVSVVGAGDSMTAGMVLGLTRGLSITEAAMFGVAAGTAAVMTPGTELCRREDTERLYEKIRGQG